MSPLELVTCKPTYNFLDGNQQMSLKPSYKLPINPIIKIEIN